MAPPVARRAPYKDFLQPWMQRRFASALLMLLATSYVESVALSSWDSIIWSWFPIGFAGIRALFIFGCVLLVIVLRIAHPHVGIRTTNSPMETFRQNIISLAAFETILTYTLSAFFFSQIYLRTIAEAANLQWITYHSGDRARLNERTLFYTLTLSLLGAFEGLMHLVLDYDSLSLGLVKASEEGNPKRRDPFEILLKSAPQLAGRALTVAVGVALSNYIVIYSLFLRRPTWAWTMSFFRPFYNLPKSNIPPAAAPWSIWMLSRSILAGTLLCLLWNFGNAAFSAYLATEPLKHGQPLTSESKDPNGSLLNGLRSKKPRIASFAMWELALIARDYDVRRKAIFEDIDRKDGPMWSQIYKICFDYIKALEKRIHDYGKPPAPPPAPDSTAQPKPAARVVEPPVSANVWQPAPPPKTLGDSLGKLVADVTKSPGKKPIDTIVPQAKKTVAEIRDALLTKQQQERLNREGIVGIWHGSFLWLLQLPVVGKLGWPFQQLYSRRLTTAILGTPYGDVSLYVNAAFTLSRLAVASLEEDNYGNVHRDVATIIRTLTTVIKKLEIFEENFPIHWTDTQGERRCAEVDEVLDALKEALGRVVGAFERYSTDLRLNRTDIRLAKEAAEKKGEGQAQAQDAIAQVPGENQPEMRQIG